MNVWWALTRLFKYRPRTRENPPLPDGLDSAPALLPEEQARIDKEIRDRRERLRFLENELRISRRDGEKRSAS